MRSFFEKQAAKLGLVGTAAVAYVENAMAAVPAAVTSALEGAGTDAVAVATVVLVAVVGLVAFHWMRREAK